MNYSKTLDVIFNKMDRIVDAEKNERDLAARWKGIIGYRVTSTKLIEDLYEEMYRLDRKDAVVMLNSITRAEESTMEEAKYMDLNSVQLEESRISIKMLNRLGKMLSVVNANNMIGLVENTAVYDLNVEDVSEEQLLQDTKNRVELYSIASSISERALPQVRECVAGEKEVAMNGEGTQSEIISRACDIVDSVIARQMDKDNTNDDTMDLE